MKNFKSILTAVVMTVLFCACGSSNDDPTPAPQPNPNPGTGTFKGVIFATSVTNPEGNSGASYMQALTDLLPGTYDNSNALPVGFGTKPIATASGNVYVLPDYMGNTKPELNRYQIDAAGKWIKKGTLLLPANAAACNIVELNNEKAYVSLQGLGIVMAFNPTTMKKLADIDLNDLKQTVPLKLATR